MDAVLNWLWQGGVVALAAAGLLRVIPRSHTPARYSAAWIASLLVLVLPAMPLLSGAASPIQAATDYRLTVPGPLVSMPGTWWTSTSLAIGLWILWAGVHAGWLAAAGLSLRRTRRRCREFPESVEIRLHHWSRVKTTGRRTHLVLSTRVRSAAVLCCGSPVIAIAPSILERLGDEDLDRIVIHEWAHVQRRDDIAQYLQLAVRITAGWHPAVWWLERQLELEREVACDETAVMMTGSARGYAACLTTLAALSRAVRPAPALAAVSSSGLHRRIVRILAARPLRSARPGGAIAVAAGAALAALALTVGNLHLVQLAVPVLSLRAATSLIEEPSVAPEVPGHARTLSDPQLRVESRSISLAARRSRLSEEPTTLEPHEDRPSLVAVAFTSSSAGWPFDSQVAPSVEMVRPADAPVTSPTEPFHATAAADNRPPDEPAARTPWSAAADAGGAIGRGSQNAGVAIGRGSQNAGVATASFFSRVSKRIAGSF